jgi:hypothetical protein
MPAPEFRWGPRPGSDMDHIASHGMTTDLWDAAYFKSMIKVADKDDPDALVAEGGIRGQLYRMVYGLDGGIVMPITINPITGFPLNRSGMQRKKR